MMTAILTHLRGIISRPYIDDMEMNQRARLIHAILLTAFVINALFLLWKLVTAFNAADTYISNFLFVVVLLGFLALLSRGYVRVTAHVLVWFLWIDITQSTYFWGGVLDALYPSYIVVVLITGWVLNVRYAVVVVVLSSAMGYLYMLEHGFTDDAIWAWEASTAIFAIGAFIGYLSQKILRDNLKQAEHHKQALERINNELTREIEERQQIESALRKREMQYQQLIEMSPVAMLIGDREEFKIKYANARALQLFGEASGKAMIGQSIRDRLSPESQAQYRNRIESIQDHDTLPIAEYSIRRPNGEPRNIEVGSIQIDYNGEPATLSVLHDITHRKEIEKLHRENESRYRNLLEAIPIALVVADHDTNKIVYVNPKAIELLGANNQRELIGMPFTIFVIDDYKKLADERYAILERDGYVAPGEYRYRRLDGDNIDVEIATIRTEYQGEMAYLSVFSDITARKQMQDQLLKAELLHSTMTEKNKVLAMKDTFMTTISHEFRTPLTVINSSKELLEKYYDRMDENRRQEHFNKMGKEIRYMTKLLDDILFLSEASSGMLEFEPQRVDIRLLCSDVFDEYKQKYTGKHTFDFDHITPDDKTVFRLNEDLIRQTLKHLMENAVKYSPDGGQIKLSLQTSPEEAIIKVSDQGVGIPESLQDNLFEPFKRGKHNQDVSSIGLGLAIIKQVVDVHNGQIICESEVDHGTTFTLTLPATP